MPALPSPSQSPTRGFQFDPPYWNCPASGAPVLAELRRYQVAEEGSKTPMASLPAPSQSPVTATQPFPPYWKGVTFAAPDWLVSLRYHVAVDGSNTDAPAWAGTTDTSVTAGTTRSSSASRISRRGMQGLARRAVRP